MTIRPALSAIAFYVSLSLGAIHAGAAEISPTAVEEIKALRGTALRTLAIHAEPRRSFDAEFLGDDGSKITMTAYQGQVVLLNFWATWCAPCREEMPHLNALSQEFAGENFSVVTVATGYNSPTAMKKFFRDHAIDALPMYTDPRSVLGRQAGALGLPVTLLLDRQGREIARMTGGADWNAPEAQAIIRKLLALTEPAS